jgi:hypothetical protein
LPLGGFGVSRYALDEFCIRKALSTDVCFCMNRQKMSILPMMSLSVTTTWRPNPDRRFCNWCLRQTI